jgi:hypothetical protein
MKTYFISSKSPLLIAVVGFLMAQTNPAFAAPSDLQITRDPDTGKVTVSWNGKGVLKQATGTDGRFKPVRKRGSSHTITPDAELMLFTLESAQSPIYSVNAVGYVNTQLRPGLSLINNPLLNTVNTVESLMRDMPDGTQVYKYVSGVGYEVSSYDAAQGLWSNPDMDLSPGIGFFVDNPSAGTVVNTFVGEVLQGVLVNNLPAGFSTEGSLVPQAGSINDLHGIPGETGDVIRLYANDGQGGGSYVMSVFADGVWTPDLTLGVGEGFISEKQNAQDWIRIFSVFP